MTDPRKAAFDAARRADDDRTLTANEVRVIHAALDAVGWPRTPVVAPSARRIGPDGVGLIKRFEGCARMRSDGRIEAYPDPGTGGAPWTIGWGSTGPDVRRGTIWTQEQADAMLESELIDYADEVSKAIGDAPTTQLQFDALVSFHYNTGAIARATLTKLHKAGDFVGAAAQFGRWNKAGGRVLAGLTKRRAAEAELYRRGS